VFAELRAEIERLPAAERTLGNRYWRDSLAHASRFRQDWNRSYELAPEAPRCGALLVHGLTDSPYSMRALAGAFAGEGCLAIALRMPGHGTTPAALLETEWEDWAAAVRVGWRGLAASVGPGRPLFLVGYSNGGALVLDLALDQQRETALPRPAGILVLSPMIGVAGPADLPLRGRAGGRAGTRESALAERLPEFNPSSTSRSHCAPRARRRASPGMSRSACARCARVFRRCSPFSRRSTPRFRPLRWSAICSRGCRRTAASWCSTTWLGARTCGRSSAPIRTSSSPRVSRRRAATG
jgi:pimeloyl-ACP methyl ester carboxylesterase